VETCDDRDEMIRAGAAMRRADTSDDDATDAIEPRRQRSALAMPDAGPHPTLLLAELATALASFLDAHESLSAARAVDPHRLERVVRWRSAPFKPRTAFRGPMLVPFPTYARRLVDRPGWRVTVAGMVSRPLPERSHRRRLAVAMLRRLLDLDESQVASDVFRRRADAFFFQRLAGQRVTVALPDRSIDAGPTDRTGHFHVTFDVDGAPAEDRTGPSGETGLSYEVTAEDDVSASGFVHLVEPTGSSVISDIDDTVKVTNVADRRELLRNTFLREFAAVPGMPDVYRRWRAGGTAFHYVSASPWQLSRCLCGFLDDVGLPAGSMHLKLFRLKDSTPLGRLPSRKRSKRRVIEEIMRDFPGRKFLLVGDSGEVDPEVYASVARRRGPQVSGIAIRLVAGRIPEHRQRERLAALARRLPAGSLRFFTAPEELAGIDALR
jgi:phosphatidate phosphatase APP1